MIAETLHCASCGAAVSSDAPVCGHCGARLATMACPSCFHMMFTGSKFCPHCGKPAVAWEPAPENSPCPRCQVPLLRGKLGDSILFQCAKCFGFWVDKTMFEQICRQAEAHSPGLAFAETEPGADRGAPLESIRYVRCPVCRTFMNRVNFAQCSGVVVDVCREHGTWFDADELQRVVQFVRDGGLGRARQQQLLELEKERRRSQQARLFAESDFRNARTAAGPPTEPFYQIIHDLGSWLSQ